MWLTGIDNLLIRLLASEFDIDEVDLEFLVCLDTNQERRTTASGDHFIGVMLRLEDKGEGTLELLEDSLNELSESDAFVRLRVIDIFRKNGDGFGIGFAFEFEATVLEDQAEGSRVGDDAVVYDDKIAVRV